MSKLFEKVVHKQILDYFTENDLFIHAQHGFRPGYSTESAGIELIDRLKQNIDKGHASLCVFMDLSKAFDTIDHQILLEKLKYYGLSDSTLSWFQ